MITFTTHNVKGLKNTINIKQIIEHFNLQNIDIIGLTETHYTQNQQFICKYQNQYDTFWSHNEYSFSGIGLLIKKTWSKYIQKIHNNNE